jgi:hypothetical protein
VPGAAPPTELLRSMTRTLRPSREAYYGDRALNFQAQK